MPGPKVTDPQTAAETAATRMLTALTRSSGWELVHETVLPFAAHHPQGMTFANGLTFLSSVELMEEPIPAADPARRTAGAGHGHVFVIDARGELVRDIGLGEGRMYHPGGIDFDGESIWVPIAEYRAASQSIVYTIDPDTLEARERFRVDDHIGWCLRDPDLDRVFGGSWGSRRLHTWTTDGTHLDTWENPSHFVDYQDAQHLGEGLLLCTGISLLPSPQGAPFELGGLALVDPSRHIVVHDVPVSAYTSAGHVITRNPVALTAGPEGFLLHVAPDDSEQAGQTRVLTYRSV